MTAPGTPKASQAAIAAVQEALGCILVEREVPTRGLLSHLPSKVCGTKGHRREGWTERGCPVAVAAADAAAPHNAAQALRAFADTRGVNVGDEDGDWWTGYRQAQRECLQDAVRAADRIEVAE